MSDPGSYEERHARAEEVFGRFVPGVAPGRVFGSMERRFGALGSFGFDAVGDLWSRRELSRRDRSLLVLSVLSAQARDEELELHTQVALHHGLTRPEIEEILLHVAAYAGFPAAMASFRRMDAAFRKAEGVERIEGRKPAERLSDAERDRRAADVRRTLTGGRAAADPATDLANMQRILGDVGTLAFRWAFGEIWSRPELSRRDRSLVVIALLGRARPGARARLPRARRPQPRPHARGDRGDHGAPVPLRGLPEGCRRHARGPRRLREARRPPPR